MKKAELAITLSYVNANVKPYRYCSISIHDEVSGVVIAEVSVEPEAFYSMMSTCGRTKCTGRVFDNYDKIGMECEHTEFEIEDGRLKDYRADLDEIIADHAHLWECDGWKARPHSIHTMSQGQWNGNRLRVKVERYVKEATR